MLSKNKLFLLNIKNQETLSAYIFMAPTILILGVFLLLPILFAVVLAFHKVQPLGEISYNFRGWKNFLRITNDERVWIALKNTVEYVILVVPIQTVLALTLALILNA